MSEILRIDNSKRGDAATCLRKFCYAHVLGIKPKVGSTALRYGSVWHEVMDTFYSHIKENGWTRDGKAVQAAILVARTSWEEYSEKQVFYEDYRTLPNLLRAFLNYVSYFSSDEGSLKVIGSERSFRIFMEPTDEERKIFPNLEPFNFTGMLDLEVELNGRPWILDHKTTSQELGRQSERLQRAAQFIG
jgi:hypothetical protein